MLLFLQIECENQTKHIVSIMKKHLATYLTLCLSALLFTSCWGDEDQELLSPYAMIKSFSIGNIKSSYPAFTSDGRDTTVVRTVDCSSLSFTIDQTNGIIYNNDSLLYSTDLTKIVTSMEVLGAASIYVDSTGTYDYYASTDSTDFTKPRKFRIYSEGGSYHKDYVVSVNAHQVDPELMVWKKEAAIADIVPYGIAELADTMHLFGKNGTKAVVASSPVAGDIFWTTHEITTLPESADLTTVQYYKDALYIIADSTVYTSSDAVNWSPAATIPGAAAIIGASDADMIMVATDKEILGSADGSVFETMCSLPEGFPLYGISIASYPMVHNSDIIRYMVIGYATGEMDGNARVWSRLSTEGKWTEYDNDENPFPCPTLKGLEVIRYDNFFYAFGGAGTAEGETVKAFETFYISKDNGIVWKSYEDFYQKLPGELAGNDNRFIATTDSKNYIWIVNSGEGAATYRGIINRLGFDKK